MDQLPIFPRYRIRGGEELFPTLQAAAEALGRVTLDTEHKLIRRPAEDRNPIYSQALQPLLDGTYSRETLFKEIEAVPQSDALNDCYAGRPGERAIEPSYLAEMGVEALMRAVADRWDPDQVHIVIHSSGYDSRILGGVLRQMADQRGMDWLGETYFVCWQPEIAYWRDVMDYMEWPEEMRVPIYPGRHCVDYFREACAFDALKNMADAHRWWTGPVQAVETLRKKGLDLSRAMVASALFGDETQKWNRLRAPDTLGAFLACYLFDIPSAWPVYGSDVLLPFACRPWLTLMQQYAIPIPVDHMKLEILNILDPGLADVHRLPNYRFVAGPLLKSKGHHPYQIISEKTVSGLKAAVEKSWYGREVLKGKVPAIEPVVHPYSEEGNDVIKAAVCEGLIEAGVRVSS